MSGRTVTLLRWIGILMLLATAVLSARAPVAHAAPQRPEDTPEAVVRDELTGWTLGDGRVYWAKTCIHAGGSSYLRRKSAQGGGNDTLSTVTGAYCLTFLNMAADASGLYYYERHRGIYHRPVADPYDPPTLVYEVASDYRPTTDLEVQGDYVYWASAYDRIYRVRKDGTGLQHLVASAPNPTDLLVVGHDLYWLDDNGLWLTMTNCSSPPCAKTRLHERRGDHLAYGGIALPGYMIYWVEDGDPVENQPQGILSAKCGPGFEGTTCILSSRLYTADTEAWELGQLRVHDAHLYWPERKTTSPVTGRLRRMDVSGDPPYPLENLTQDRPAIDDRLYIDDRYVYFAELEGSDMGISRLPFDASALRHDLAADALEVTQGIQNLANDVPLVADKTTFVRGYGENRSARDAWSVEAVLHGSRQGAALPGSPLWPINGRLALRRDWTYDREQLNHGWLFQLPPDWLDGTVRFDLEVDPRDEYSDPNRANNIVTDFITFHRKAPVCHTYVSVSTQAGAYASVTENPNFYGMLARAESLWPVHEIRWATYARTLVKRVSCGPPGIPRACNVPFELPADGSEILSSLEFFADLSGDPPGCTAVGARTHYVGAVHPDTSPSVLGMALLDQNVAWVRFPPHSASGHLYFLPRAGVEVAKQLGHNQGRKSVDCPGGHDDVDNDYPYPRCQLGELGPEDHYGFDARSFEVIHPLNAADLMSYLAQSRWVSDYTWKGIFNSLQDRPGGRSSKAATAAATVRDSTAAAYLRGNITPSRSTGILHYAWVYPTGALGASVLQKWEELAAPAHPGSVANGGYQVRLLDANDNVMAERLVTPHKAADDPAEHPVLVFHLTFPAPAGTVARIELLADGSVLDAAEPGSGTPTVAVQAPAGGETIGDELQITWQASDPDQQDLLLFNVQYSPDGGSTWFALLTDYPGPPDTDTVSVTVDARSLQGSGPNQARIRVAASDGYNTSLALSGPFTVSDRPPQAYVFSPAAGQAVPAGRPVQLRGGAMDIEDGPLSDASLTWTVDGGAAGQGEEQWLYGKAPGEYDVVLKARDSAAQEAMAQATLRILPLGIPEGSDLSLDGFCEDEAYLDGAQIQLKPYDDGSRATVHLVRTAGHLWACFSGMPRHSDSAPAGVGLRIDIDHSQDAQAQTDDYGFFVRDDSSFNTQAGNGSGGFVSPGPGGLSAQVSATENTWSGELRIDAGVLGGWGHPVGLRASHYRVPSATVVRDWTWPAVSGWASPNAWAEAVLGTLPWIASLEPASVQAGGPAFELVVTGERFLDGAQVRWNGVALPTEFGSSTVMTATVDAAKIGAAGEAAVTVRNPGGDLDSNTLPFVIHNPVPEITSLSPNSTSAGGPAFTLTVNGADFVDGAEVLWDGESLATSYVSSTQLEAQVEAARITIARAAGIAVRNPTPSGGVSQAVTFRIEGTGVGPLYLPLVIRDGAP